MAELSFRIPEMNGAHSAKVVTAALRRLSGVSNVEIDLHTKWVVVSGDMIDSRAIRRAVVDAGFEPDV